MEAGETLPHWDTGQVTLQVTPRLEVSLFTVAVNEAVPPAGTLGEPAAIETEMTGGGDTMELPPPQPSVRITEVKSRVVRRTEVARFIDASTWLNPRAYGTTCP